MVEADYCLLVRCCGFGFQMTFWIVSCVELALVYTNPGRSYGAAIPWRLHGK
jgi:hypothetical protein